MAVWSQTDLAAIGAADELQIAPARADGCSGQATTIWVVRVGDELYVRCYRGAAGGWYRRALRSRHGLIRAGGREREVTFEDADPAAHGEIDRGLPVHVRRLRQQLRRTHGRPRCDRSDPPTQPQLT